MEFLAVDSFSCLFKLLICSKRYNCLYFISIFAWILLKRAGNKFENVGIILRITGEFKKNCQKEYVIGKSKA